MIGGERMKNIKKAQQLYEVLELKASTRIENVLKNLCVEFLEESIRMKCVQEESFCKVN